MTEPKSGAAKMRTPKYTLKSPEALAADVEAKVIRRYKAAAKEDPDRAALMASVEGTSFDEKTHTVTFVVSVSKLAQQHWKLDIETRKVTGVHVSLNRITEKQNHDLGLMRHVPGTDVWVRTLPLSPTYRGGYSFQLMTDEEPAGPRSDYCGISDPFFAESLDVDEEGRGTSLLSGPLAPNQEHWSVPGFTAPGTILSTYLEDVDLQIYAYLPALSTQPCRLLTLFDAESWFFKFDLPQALERTVFDGMEPVAVLGIVNRDNEHRQQQLKANAEFLDKVKTAGEAWIRREAEEAGVVLDPAENIIAGQSLGGLSALYAGLLSPGHYSSIIAQSPSLWFSPDPGSTPRDLINPSHGWLTEQYYRAKALPKHIILNVGVREGEMVNKAHMLSMALKVRDVEHELHVYDGGHDWAWWRVALLEHLGAQPNQNLF